MKFLELLNKPVTFRRRPAEGSSQDKAAGQTDEQATAESKPQPCRADNKLASEASLHATQATPATHPAHPAQPTQPTPATPGSVAAPTCTEQQQLLLAQYIDEAALLFATEQPDAAARLLSAALETRLHEASEIEQRAWWMLLELHQARGQQGDFDRAALAYAQRFEASPPQWTALHEEPQLRVRDSTPAAPLLLSLRGALSADAQPTLLQWRQRSATTNDINLDLAQVTSVDLAGCHLLLDLFSDWQQRSTCVQLRACDSLRVMLHALIQSGRRDADDAGWRLLIELLRLAGDVERYEDACLAYSLTFEMSPPAAPPPVANDPSKLASGTRATHRHRTGSGAGAGAISGTSKAASAGANAGSGARPAPANATTAFALPEVITMPIDPVLVALRAHVRQAGADMPALVLDAHKLQRIDFHAASVLQSALTELAAGKTVEWQGVSFLVSTLLQLTCGSAMPGIINRMP